MREILFRGKCFNTEEWVEGYLGIEVPDELVIQQFSYDEYFKSNCIDQYSVKPETIGQYTGLTDKNGRKIFEGDVVKISNGEIFEVKYEDGGFTAGLFLGDWDYGHVEVIGNIYDNPELLNGGDDNAEKIP